MAKITITQTVDGKEVVTDFECDQYCVFMNNENRGIGFRSERQCSASFMAISAATALDIVAKSIGPANTLHLAVDALTHGSIVEEEEECPCERSN